MDNVIRCERCGIVISDISDENTNKYRHRSVKYCDDCRKTVIREQTAERMKRYRQNRQKEIKIQSLKEEQIILLEKQNELLKENIKKIKAEKAYKYKDFPLYLRLINLRIDAGYSQKYVCEQLNISQNAVHAWECGKAMPTISNLERIVRLYGLPEDYFYDIYIEKIK